MDSVFQHKKELKLPDVLHHKQQLSPMASPGAVEETDFTLAAAASQARIGQAGHARQRNRYCDANGKASLKALQNMVKESTRKGRNKRAATLEADELGAALPSQRNLLLANSPQEQYLWAIANSSKASPRLNYRSMLNGSNAKIKEGRFSAIKNSPSGKYLCHPGSRFPDEMNRAPPIGESEPDSHVINASNSVANLVSASEFLPSTKASVTSKQNTAGPADESRNKFSKRSFSVQPAPVQDPAWAAK